MKNFLKSWFPTDGKIISNLIRGWATIALAVAMILFALAAVFFFLSFFLTPILDLDFEDIIIPAMIGVGGGFTLVFAAYFQRLIAYSLAAWTEASSIYIEHSTCSNTKNSQNKKQEVAKTNYYEPSGKVKVIAKDDTFIDIICPHCGKQVSFASDIKSASCPWCDTNINIH